MTILETVSLGIGVSLDAFAIALATSLQPIRSTWRRQMELVVIMASCAGISLFAAITLGHWFAGQEDLVPPWLLPILLAGIGFDMILRANDDAQPCPAASHNLFSVIVLGMLASVDVGAVGVAIGLEKACAGMAQIVIPSITALSTLMGILLSGLIARWLGDVAPILGGGVIMLTASGMCW